jgi:uncharacterized protein YjdB
MDTSIASISTVGVVSGVSPGVATIYYASSFSYAFATVTVDPMPVAIAGIHAVCQGGTSTLTDATAGGTWISSDPSVAIVGPTSGVVSGAAATGTATITYKTPLAGCAATTSFTVALSGSVTGVSEMCAGNSSGFMHTFGGGIWYSSNPSAATVNTSGLVTGVAAGTSVISYSLSTTGCDAEQALTVNARPVPSVAGSSSVCLGYTTTLTGTPAGGTWLSTDVSKATINASTGVITGMANGTATMKYFVTGSCGMDSTTTVVTVKSAAPCVNGVSNPFALAEELKVFPNPSKGAFSLNVLSATDDVAHIVITNIVGEKVKEFTLSTNAINSISLGQPAGIYFLSATTLNSKYFVKIVVE